MARGKCVKVADGLFIVGRGGWGGNKPLSGPGDCNVYLVDSGKEAALVDAGAEAENEAIIANIRAAGVEPRKVKKVILTHAHGDHSAGAPFLAARLGAQILAGVTTARALAEGDSPLVGGAMPFEPHRRFAVTVDRWLADGEAFQVGDVEFKVLSTPGHVLDGMCYVCEIDGKKVLFSGDTAIGNQPRRDMGVDVRLEGMLGWLDRHWSTPVSTYVKTLRRLARLKVDMLLPGHGLPNDAEDARSGIAKGIKNLQRLMADGDLFILVALDR